MVGALLQSYCKTINELLPAIALPVEIGELSISRLVLDSRQAVPGCGFMAIQGGYANGADYIDAAIVKGSAIVFCHTDETTVSWSLSHKVPYIFIPDLLANVSAIANRFYDFPSKAMSIVGITGTNGKTTCSQLIGQLLALNKMSCAVLGTLGYGIYPPVNDVADIVNHTISLEQTGMTTPDAITTQAILADMARQHVGCAALEVSSHGLMQQRVADVDINTAIFTNLSHDHLDYHGDMTHYANAKKQLFLMASVKKAIVNIDDEFGLQLQQELITAPLSVTTFGVHNSSAHFWLSDISYNNKGITFTLNTPVGSRLSSTVLVGEFNLSNLLAVVAVCIKDERSLNYVAKMLPHLQPVAGRMELVKGHNNAHVIVDYAHTPDALKNALTAARQHCSGRLICVFGCGGDRDVQKRPVMAEVAEALADIVIVTNDNPRYEDPITIINDIMQGFKNPDGVVSILDRAEAIFTSVQQATPGDIIVLAGKGHEAYQQIGNHKHPFSDKEIAARALARKQHLQQVGTVDDSVCKDKT